MIFSRGTTLLAAPFNIKDSSTGAAIPVADGVAVELPGSGGGRHYAISRSGALVYVPAADAYKLVVIGANAASVLSGNSSARWKIRGFRPMAATWSSPQGAATMKRRTSGCTTCTRVQPLV